MFSQSLQNSAESRIRGITQNGLARLFAVLGKPSKEITAVEHAERVLRREKLERAARARTDILLKAHQRGLGG